MISNTGAYGNIGAQYSEEGARIARHSIDASKDIHDSYDRDKLLDEGLEEIKKSPATTLDEKIIAQFGIDAARCLKDRENSFDAFAAISEMTLNSIGAAIPGTIGNVIMGMAGEAALISQAPEDRSSLETAARNNLAFHRGLNIMSQHKTGTQEEMAIKELGAQVIHLVSNDKESNTAQGTGTAATKDNGELAERAATILVNALASPLQGCLGRTIASTVHDIVTEDLSTYTKNCVLGYGLTAIQDNPKSTPVEKAMARFSKNTTVHMLDGAYSALVSAAVIDAIAAPTSDVEHRELAKAVMNAAGQYTSWGDRDRRGVLYEGLRHIAENKSATEDVRKLAKKTMKADESMQDHHQAVETMTQALKEIELMQTPKETAEIELRKSAENLRKMADNPGRESASTVEIDDEFIDIGGIRLRRNSL
jgi:hypothetical protein